MGKIETFLQKLELSEIESKLYLTLLQHGPTSVRELAETITIKRTTAYFYIDQLVEKGLIMKLVKGSKKLVAANPPSSLKHLVENKVASAQHVAEHFPKILETLTSTFPQADEHASAEIKYYKGKNGIYKIYEDALASDELRSYVKLEESGGIFSDNLNFFKDAFAKNPKLRVRELLYNTPHAVEQASQTLSEEKNYLYKLMPSKLKLTSGDVLIYANKVAIINYTRNMHAVVLENADYFNNSKELFDFIWELIPK